jgi:UDP-N-acetylglucosamine 1-carboxyvinyltransferase
MIAAALAEGVTTIEAGACEPEVVDLGNLLNAMGARITGLGTPTLRIDGVERLFGVTHRVIPDRIEAATLMLAAAITRGNVRLTNVCTEHMTAIIEKLREIGLGIDIDDDSMQISAAGPLRPVECIALPYPAIPTDVQAQLTALLSTVPGMSIVIDKVFPDRFLHAPELVRMGARIRREGNSAIVSGVEKLSGACVMASDLRASAALVLAGLAATGPTVVRRIYHLDRGYEHLEVKLRQLGAEIERVRDEPQNVPDALQVAQYTPVSPPHFDPAARPVRNRPQ